MQSLGQNYTRINKKHPDAAGCVAAWPMADGPLSMRNAVSRRYNLTATSGARAGMSRGLGHRNLTAFTYSTADSFPTPTSFSLLATHVPDQVGGFPRELFEVNGVVFMTEIAKELSLYTVAGSFLGKSTIAMTLGLEYSLGIRYNVVTQLSSYFINGALVGNTNDGALTFSSTVLSVGGGGFRNSGSGTIRDIRIYHRAMPDITFSRYYLDPNSFYVRSRRRVLKGVSFNGGRMMPFLHPYLTS